MAYDKGLSRSHAVVMILAVLNDGARHGYDIAREVERRSNNKIEFKDGTLYPILRSLEGDGLIVSNWEGSDGERKRRNYTILPAGLAELQHQTNIWNEYSSALNNVLTGEQKAFSSLLKAWGFQ